MFYLSQFSDCCRIFFWSHCLAAPPEAKGIHGALRFWNSALVISMDPDIERGTRWAAPQESYESPLRPRSGIQRLRVAVFGGSHFRRAVFGSILGSAPPRPLTHNATTMVSGSGFPRFLVCFVMDPDVVGGIHRSIERQRPSET